MHHWNYDTVVGNVRFKYIRHFGAEILLQQRKSSRLQLWGTWPNLAGVVSGKIDQFAVDMEMDEFSGWDCSEQLLRVGSRVVRIDRSVSWLDVVQGD